MLNRTQATQRKACISDSQYRGGSGDDRMEDFLPRPIFNLNSHFYPFSQLSALAPDVASGTALGGLQREMVSTYEEAPSGSLSDVCSLHQRIDRLCTTEHRWKAHPADVW